MKRFFYMPLLTLMGFVSVHCGTDEVRFINVSPSVTSIGPIEALEGNHFKMYLSLADWESDPVDIHLEWSDSEGNGGPIQVVPLQGHGLIGLSSSPDGAGTLHEVHWTGDFNDSESIQIQITPNDLISEPGLTVTSPEFSLETGYNSTHYP